jgi:glucose/arabinose dehydrogenase
MAPAAPPGAPPGIALRLEQINIGLTFPLFLTTAPGDTLRLFVVEKGGVIKVVDRASNALIGTFLNISGLVSTGGEQGLLGLAFDPQYVVNRRFYISYTGVNGNSVIARYLRDPLNPNVALGAADQIIMTVAQPFANHNGGMIAFGPDNYLYIGLGDGGSGGDPFNNGQNTGVLLGKLLRIDVSQAAPEPYGIPSDNPCVGQADAREEIWSIGLRNPWRYSFDRQSGDLYVADVGQSAREEVNVSTSAGGAGRGTNYGWRIMEGTLCFSPSTMCSTAGLALPAVDYAHVGGACSITGGYTYRGGAIPALQGTYFYADFCAGFVRSFRLVNGQVTEHADWPVLAGGNITSFGEDAAGELYIMTSQGGLFRIVPN